MTAIPVDPARLAFDTGDISESYSADRIAEGKPIRAPFRYEADLWTCVSSAGAGLTTSGSVEFQAYRLTPINGFKGVVTSYREKIAPDCGDAARADPNGFYDRVRVDFKSSAFVLTGPPQTFIAGEATRPEPEAQMSLFGEAFP